MSDAYAELFEHNPVGSPIPCPIAGDFFKWATAEPGIAGPDDLMVPDVANDQLLVEERGAGVYLTLLSMAYSADRNNIKTEGGVFKNGIILPNVRFNRRLGVMTDEASVVAIGLVELVASDVLDVRISTDFMNTTIQIIQCTLSALANPRAIAIS